MSLCKTPQNPLSQSVVCKSQLLINIKTLPPPITLWYQTHLLLYDLELSLSRLTTSCLCLYGHNEKWFRPNTKQGSSNLSKYAETLTIQYLILTCWRFLFHGSYNHFKSHTKGRWSEGKTSFGKADNLVTSSCEGIGTTRSTPMVSWL